MVCINEHVEFKNFSCGCTWCYMWALIKCFLWDELGEISMTRLRHEAAQVELKAGDWCKALPLGWLALVKGKPGSQPCKCTVPLGRQSTWFCGTGRPTAKRDVAKLWTELRAGQ